MNEASNIVPKCGWFEWSLLKHDLCRPLRIHGQDQDQDQDYVLFISRGVESAWLESG